MFAINWFVGALHLTLNMQDPCTFKPLRAINIFKLYFPLTDLDIDHGVEVTVVADMARPAALSITAISPL